MDSELEPSELGTQAYWQNTYANDNANFDDHGDTGDVWFGEDSACRVIDWICMCYGEKSAAIIDIGSGNGYTLTELARKGFTNLLGIDYSSEAITLANKVSTKEFPCIKYLEFDILQEDVTKLGRFSIVHDKGTYDAIGLNPVNAKAHRLRYIDRVAELVDDGGYFIITSCNWTEEELLEQFSEKFQLKHVIPTPRFKFGGTVGGVVSSVVFERRSLPE